MNRRLLKKDRSGERLEPKHGGPARLALCRGRKSREFSARKGAITDVKAEKATATEGGLAGESFSKVHANQPGQPPFLTVSVLGGLPLRAGFRLNCELSCAA